MDQVFVIAVECLAVRVTVQAVIRPEFSNLRGRGAQRNILLEIIIHPNDGQDGIVANRLLYLTEEVLPNLAQIAQVTIAGRPLAVEVRPRAAGGRDGSGIDLKPV